jgi:heme/copper-type cytochrome/quinol oxidase subunit 3
MNKLKTTNSTKSYAPKIGDYPFSFWLKFFKPNVTFNYQSHGFHLVDPSPWPFVSAFSALMLTSGGVLYMHGYNEGFTLWTFGLFMVLFMMFCWWRDIIREGTLEGQHTSIVQLGLRYGMLLFIVSEIMFFFAFFWAFFHSSFNPSPSIGGVWPPAFLTVLDPWKIPLLNTILLLSSGATITWAHHSIVLGSYIESIRALFLTIFLAIIFTWLQKFEYSSAPFSISDGIYGSTFYMATGFHGFHVFVGTCFLIVCLIRLDLNHFTTEHHFGFEAAAWYWHFVDIVWLFLFITIYWWGS